MAENNSFGDMISRVNSQTPEILPFPDQEWNELVNSEDGNGTLLNFLQNESQNFTPEQVAKINQLVWESMQSHTISPNYAVKIIHNEADLPKRILYLATHKVGEYMII